MTSLSGLERLMEAGGRRVSANYALATDGTLVEKVPVNRRAFTSASVFDERCLTVETVNTTGGPGWGISDASHKRLGKLAAEMLREGLLAGLHYGPGGIIGHRDVPGSYPTACPGPSYSADLILKYAREELREKEDDKMLVFLSVKGEDIVRVMGGGYRYQFASAVELETFRAVLENSGHTVPPVLQVPSSFTASLFWRASVDEQPVATLRPAAVAAPVPFPTASEIAAEVMRQQKLSGN